MNWPTEKLEDMTMPDRAITYGVVKPGPEDDTNGVLFVRGGDIKDSKIDIGNLRTITQQVSQSYKRTLLRGGELLISLVGNPGEVGIVPDSLAGSNIARQAGLIALKDKYNSRFVLYFLKSPRGRNALFQRTKGSVQQVINLSDLKTVLVPQPEEDIQDSIASILSAYDDLIENNRKRIALLEESARLLYREWFVHLRFPGHETTKTIDGVPEGWEKTNFEKVCETIGGGTPSTKVPEYWADAEITWITPTDITRNDCLALLDGEKNISLAGLKKSSAKLVPPNTILMTSRASVGFFGLIDKEVCTNQGFINIIPNEESCRFYLLFNLINRVEEIRAHSGGSTYKEISKGKFRRLPVTIPSEIVRDKFDDIVRPVITQIRALKKQSFELAKARDILLPRLMDGRVEL